MTTLFMVRSNPKPGQETAFNDWYTDVHLPEVLSIQGFLSAQRFTLNEAQVQPDQSQSYLAIYEIVSIQRVAGGARTTQPHSETKKRRRGTGTGEQRASGTGDSEESEEEE